VCSYSRLGWLNWDVFVFYVDRNGDVQMLSW
jgi:hypothetical protein